MCGVTSRRGAEALIKEGRVVVNSRTLDQLGTIIDEEKDVVLVDGVAASLVTRKYYVLLNKARRVMSTLHDPFQRRTVVHSLKGFSHRVYPIGRLDYDTSGVLLLTNDGELAYRLAHPRYKVEKVYEVLVEGEFSSDAVEEIKYGIRLDDGKIGRAEVRILGYTRGKSRLRMTLAEGRKREVRQLCAKVGHPVISLTRIDFAGITARGLKKGQWRQLSPVEVQRLKEMVGLSEGAC